MTVHLCNIHRLVSACVSNGEVCHLWLTEIRENWCTRQSLLFIMTSSTNGEASEMGGGRREGGRKGGLSE